MKTPIELPSLTLLKQQAKTRRLELETAGRSISHSRSLELVAHQYGFKDWNGLHAAAAKRPTASPVFKDQRVSGSYLGQAFVGSVKSIQAVSPHDLYRVTVVFDEAVDVITFEGMSNFRKQVRCVIDRHGRTIEKTSNGQPHLHLDLDEDKLERFTVS